MSCGGGDEFGRRGMVTGGEQRGKKRETGWPRRDKKARATQESVTAAACCSQREAAVCPHARSGEKSGGGLPASKQTDGSPAKHCSSVGAVLLLPFF